MGVKGLFLRDPAGGTWGVIALRLSLGWDRAFALFLIMLGGKASGWKPGPPGAGAVILPGLRLLPGGCLLPLGGLASLNSSDEE